MAELKGFCQPPSWDTEEGKRLFDEGLNCRQIAERLGTTTAAVRSYSIRHWKRRETQKKPEPHPKPEQQTVQLEKRPILHPVTGLPMMGPCGEECETCWYIFRSGGLPICDYYLRTGKHRYPNQDGSCAVKITLIANKYSYRANLQRQNERQKAATKQKRDRDKPPRRRGPNKQPRKRGVTLTWDAEKALEMWLQGDSYATITESVGTSMSRFKQYVSRNWYDKKPQREAAVAARGGLRAKR